jgi:hypothetical protein
MAFGMIGPLRTGAIGLTGFAIALVAQEAVRRTAPAHLGAEAFVASLVVYPVLGVLCGVACGFLVPRTAPWRTLAVLVLANPASYALALVVLVALFDRSHSMAVVFLAMAVWIATAVATAAGAAIPRVQRAKPAHLCIECGYNLTGNVSGRCPECGRVIGGGNSGNDPGAHQESTASLRALAHATALIQALIVGVVACWTALLGQAAICWIGRASLAGDCLIVGLVAFPVVAFPTGLLCRRLLAQIRPLVLIVCANPGTFAVPYYVHDYGDVWSLMLFVWLLSAAMVAAGYGVGALRGAQRSGYNDREI